jgi:c-di-GMP-binding flagellar brake protein YcgR
MTSIFLCQMINLKTRFNPIYIVLVVALVAVAIFLKFFNAHQERNADKKNRKPEKEQNRPERAASPVNAPAQTTKKASAPDRPSIDPKKIRIPENYGLTDEQAVYFRQLCAKQKIETPESYFSDGAKSDVLFTTLITGLQAVHPATPESERTKTLIFMIREHIDNARKTGTRIASTRQMSPGELLSLSVKSGERYTADIMQNTERGLLCAAPRDSFGNELPSAPGTKLDVFFAAKNGPNYRFETKIARDETEGNGSRMILAHTDSVERMPDRRHDRKDFRKEAFFSTVTVANVVSGKKTEHKFFPSPKIFNGTILDISAGGCSIQSAMIRPIGEYMQIQCILKQDTEETIIGKVVRLHQNTPDGDTVMHIQFAKMPRATMNRIFNFIYYGDESK